MTSSPSAALARLRAADPVSSLPVPDPHDAAARAVLEEILAGRPTDAPDRPRTQRRLVMAGVVATTAVAVIAVGVVATPWSHGRPAAAAYAVTKEGDGAVSVTVHWNELRDPAALNAELASLGARTVVMLRSANGRCRIGFATDPAHSPVLRIDFTAHPELRDPAKFRDYMQAQMPWLDHVFGSENGAVFTIHPDEIPAGDTLLIPYEFEPSQPPNPDQPVLGVRSMLVRDVPACVPSNADVVYTSDGVAVR
jgi:hypothetical protein